MKILIFHPGPACSPPSSQDHATYAYGQRDDAVAAAAAAMRTATDRAGVPLAAAALQFSLRAEFIDSTVVGVSSAQRVTETLGLAAMPIPEDLWDELESLVPPSSAWLDSPGPE